MSNGKSGRKKKLDNKKILFILVVVAVLVTILFPEEDYTAGDSTTEQYATTAPVRFENEFPSESKTTQNTIETVDDGVLIFSMVDVGQADGFVLQCEGEVAVIDCGEEETCKAMVNYLNERGITKIKFIICSHPHEDHIGGTVTILNNFNVETVYLPETEGFTSDCYEELQEELLEGDYNFKYIEEGDVYYLGDTTISILEQFEPPLDEPNNYSAIMKVTFGQMDIIMTGDAETPVEKELLKSGQDISAEILKVGHHGSNTSTSAAFLDAIAPEYALISCGLANKHKHPTEKIMERLESGDITVYRTDECGTVVLTITATDIAFNCEPGDYLSGTELKEKKGNDT